MTDPVQLADGLICEREAIVKWWDQQKTNAENSDKKDKTPQYTCPVTQLPTERKFKVLPWFSKLLSAWKEAAEMLHKGSKVFDWQKETIEQNAQEIRKSEIKLQQIKILLFAILLVGGIILGVIGQQSRELSRELQVQFEDVYSRVRDLEELCKCAKRMGLLITPS